MDWLDTLLLPLFDFTGDPATGFYVGTFLLALIAAVLGEGTIVGLYSSNRGYFERVHTVLVNAHTQSIDALKRDDPEAYTYHHNQANEAYVKMFFSQTALGLGSLWPVFFAGAFLQGQFSNVHYPLPLLGWQVHYIFVFVIEYALARVVLNQLKYLIPGMQQLKQSLDEARQKAQELQALLEREKK
jgi:hypothetical protein